MGNLKDLMVKAVEEKNVGGVSILEQTKNTISQAFGIRKFNEKVNDQGNSVTNYLANLQYRELDDQIGNMDVMGQWLNGGTAKQLINVMTNEYEHLAWCTINEERFYDEEMLIGILL